MHDDLLLNPFGKAEMIYTSGRANNAPDGHFLRSTRQTNDGLFRITCNSDGTMNVHRYEGRKVTAYVLNVVCEDELIQRLAIDKTQVRILPNYWLSSDGLTQRRIDEELMENVEAIEEELGSRQKLELVLKEQHALQRVDVRFAGHWVTMTFYKQTLINVRMNGNFFGQQLWYMCADAQRRPIDFSRGFRRNTNDQEEATNSEDSEEEVRIGSRPISRASSARNSQRSTTGTPRFGRGPPPIEERENPEVVRTTLTRRTRVFENIANIVQTSETVQRVERIDNLRQIGPYMPLRRIDIPLTMPMASEDLRLTMPPAREELQLITPPAREELQLTMTRDREDLRALPLTTQTANESPQLPMPTASAEIKEEELTPDNIRDAIPNEPFL